MNSVTHLIMSTIKTIGKFTIVSLLYCIILSCICILLSTCNSHRRLFANATLYIPGTNIVMSLTNVDNSAALSAAMQLCPVDKYILIPSGGSNNSYYSVYQSILDEPYIRLSSVMSKRVYEDIIQLDRYYRIERCRSMLPILELNDYALTFDDMIEFLCMTEEINISEYDPRIVSYYHTLLYRYNLIIDLTYPVPHCRLQLDMKHGR